MSRKITDAQRERAEEILAQMPERLPESFEQDVLTYALPRSRYLFFRNGKDENSEFSTAVCSNCGKTVRFPRALLHTTQQDMMQKREHKSICPECGAVGVTMAARYSHKWLQDEALYMTAQAAEDGSLWLRVFAVQRRYPDNTAPYWTECNECLRVYLNANNRTALRWKKGFELRADGFRQCWMLSGKVNGNITAYYENFGKIRTAGADAIRKELAKTPFRYAELPEMMVKYPDMDAVEYLGRFAKNPNIEKLMKAGFDWMLADWRKGYRDGGVINWRAKDLRGFFRGAEMPVIRAVRDNCHDLWRLREYWEMRPVLGLGTKKEDFWRAEHLYGYKEFIESMARQLGTAARAQKYVRQQIKTAKKLTNEVCCAAYIRMPGETDVWNRWQDYVRMAGLCGVELQGKELTPPDIFKAHDEMAELYKTQQKAEEEAKKAKEEAGLMEDFAKRLKILQPYTYIKGRLLIRPCETPHEMTVEGIKLRHCVGTYLHRHAHGTSNIFVIRKEREPDVPFYTLELSEKLDRVVQWYGYEDNLHTPKDRAVKELIDEWMEKVVLPKKRRTKKAGNTAAGQKKQTDLAAAV